MLSGICDMHCHILPGIDDGAKDMEESMAALRMAADQGITSVIATPHFHPGRYVATADTVLRVLDEVQEEAQKRGIPVDIYPGQECYYYSELVDELDRGNALTLVGGRYVLVEFDPACIYSELLHGLTKVRNGGYIPILAHFERYQCLRSGDRLDELKRRGYKLQMNFDTLMKKESLFHKNPWRIMMQEGLVDYLGSDCHGVDFRPYRVGNCCSWLEKDVAPEQLLRVLQTNIQKIWTRR